MRWWLFSGVPQKRDYLQTTEGGLSWQIPPDLVVKSQTVDIVEVI
jgi:hypothetical protein